MNRGPNIRRVKNRLRSILSGARQAYVDGFLSFGPAELRRALEKMGLCAGDQLLLHAGFDASYGFKGTASEVTDTFLQVLGSTGALYMVSLPYGSSTIEYLRTEPTFDPLRTPSRMGLISEFYRRRPGVLRSLHPTHPILGFGPDVSSVLAGHEDCLMPCGAGSPFEHLLERSAKLAFMNVSLNTMTYFHYLEHLVHQRLPFSIYSDTPLLARSRGANGSVHHVPVKAFTPESITRRRPEVLHQWMQENGLIRKSTIGASRLVVVEMRSLAELVLRKASLGQFFYDMRP
jgi:aminoglycoside 3-N-acetyltransferase